MIGSCKHSDLATFSTHPVKSITTGEGGIVTTNKKFYYERLKKFRSHGIERDSRFPWQYDIFNTGYNYRLSDINCALGFSQLNKLEKFIHIRKKKYDYYLSKMKGINENLLVHEYTKKISQHFICL